MTLNFVRPILPPEIENLVHVYADDPAWKDELPRFTRDNVLNIAFGDAPQNVPFSMAGAVNFDELERDGTILWRLTARENIFGVTTSKYEGWQGSWEKGKNLFGRAISALPSDSDIAISGCSIQYVNKFIWTGSDDSYDLRLLLKEDSDCVPRSMFDRGPYWHLHTGWFSVQGMPEGTRRLERMHVSGLEESGKSVVRMEGLQRLDILSIGPISPRETALLSSDSLLGSMMQMLHDKCKVMLRDYITPEMSARIGLDD